MPFHDDEIAELKLLCDAVAVCQEGATYFLLTGLALPDRCNPAKVDALLCPSERDGYSSRLFFAQMVASPFARNWNFSGRIFERNWHAHSWRVPGPMRLAQMVRAHLDGFRRAQ